jgi:hypothetical protein
VGTPTRPWSWLRDFPRRARIEAEARHAYPSLHVRRRQTADGPLHVYSVDIPVPGYDDVRHVTIEFFENLPSSPRIYADGPAGRDASPHRFTDRGYRRLCVWYPDDPDARRWVPEDGLLALIGMIAHHLFKEAWWREHREWLGDEHPHGDLDDEDGQKGGRR